MPVSFEWTAKEQREYSLAKLLEYIQSDISRYHPFYRGIFRENGVLPDKIRSYRDFIEIPLTRKHDIQNDPGAFCLQPAINGGDHETALLPRTKQFEYFLKSITQKRIRDYYGQSRPFGERYLHTFSAEWEPVHYQMSVGNGGKRIAIYYTHSDMEKIVPYIAGMVYLFGFEPSMKILNLLPAMQHIGFFQMLFTEFFLDEGVSVFNTCGESSIPLVRQIEIAGSIPFDLYFATPSFINVWLKKAAAMVDEGEIATPEPVRFAVLAGEILTEESGERIHDLFSKTGSPDIQLIQSYGSVELRGAFFECREGSGFHLNPDYYFWEVLDPDSYKPVDWGDPGVLVFSHVGWHGTSLLRFWTGDFVEGGVTWKKCKECGRTMPVAHGPITRLDY